MLEVEFPTKSERIPNPNQESYENCNSGIPQETLEFQGNAKQIVIAVQRNAGSPNAIIGIPIEIPMNSNQNEESCEKCNSGFPTETFGIPMKCEAINNRTTKQCWESKGNCRNSNGIPRNSNQNGRIIRNVDQDFQRKPLEFQ